MDRDLVKVIEKRVSDLLDNEKQHAPTKEVGLLLDRISKLILRGGKRMRPQLLLMTYEAYGGKDERKLIDLCASLEFYHQFLLIHDDLIDNDSVRYNGPNIVGYYQQDSSGLGKSIAPAMGLLAGDLLFSLSIRVIAKDESLNEQQKVRLTDLLSSTNVSVIYGELLDSYNVYQNLKSFNEKRLLLTHSLKSALYSIELPMQFAAVILDLSSIEQARINSFAIAFGVLFQLVDDYSDYFTNKSVFNNRDKYRDFKQGKITYPLYIAFKKAGLADVKFLQSHLANKKLSAKDISKVVSIMEACGAKEASKNYLEPYFARVKDSLDQLNIQPKTRQRFIEMIYGYRV